MARLQLLLPVVMVHQRHHQVATALRRLHPVVTVPLLLGQVATVLRRLHPVVTVLLLLGQVATVLRRHLVVMVLRQDGRRIFDYGGPSGNMIWMLGNR